MNSCNTTDTPASPSATIEEMSDTGKDLLNKYPCKELVGSLMYLVVCTRLDIAHTVSMLARFNDTSSDHYWRAAKRVLRYLRGTAEYSLHRHNSIS